MNNNRDNGTEVKHQPDYYTIRFKKDRVDYFIDRNHLNLRPKDWVLVQAERGRDLGMVKSSITQEAMEKSQRKYPLEILHRARPEELEQLEKNRLSEEEAIETCHRYVEFRGMEMKLVDAKSNSTATR